MKEELKKHEEELSKLNTFEYILVKLFPFIVIISLCFLISIL